MIDEQNLLEGLTEAQQQAATHIDGPLLIIAGAGSGKTRVITRRVAYLINQGIPANSILAITFTNKAAAEMKQRVSAVSPVPLRDYGQLAQSGPMICTFHSLCMRILRQYSQQVGLGSGFSIFDSADQNKLIKEAMKALDISSESLKPAAVHGVISKAKNQLQTADAFARDAGDFTSKTISRIYTKYQQLLNQNNALDFDDLLLKATLAFRDHPAVLAELQERFQYLMIDEYQDTNHAQYILAHALALKHRNICVVGDPDQSIYAWRGADIQNILEFEKDYPDAKIVRLEQNYRSTKTILRIASEVISRNTQRKEKKLWTENQIGELAKLFICQNEHEEANTIANELLRLHEAGYAWNQMAVFYRVNALSRLMERSLFSAKIPYQIARGVEFYGRKEIKDVLAYLRVIANPSDEVNLERIINVPTRGVGDAALEQVRAWGIANNAGLYSALEKVGQVEGLSSRAANGVRAFVKLIEHFRSIITMRPTGVPIRDLMEELVKLSGMEAALKKLGGEEQEQIANVGELITAAAEYDEQNPQGTLENYLAQVSLVSDIDQLKDAGGAVTLMTLHAAKGLEFPVVAIMGLEEGSLPHARAREDATQMEEERRLFFVGITRAEQRLLLSCAAWRTVRGLSGPTVKSPFLREMPNAAVDIIDRSGYARGARPTQSWEEDQSTSSYEDSHVHGEFRKGQLVRHPKFGIGRIKDISGSGDQTKADVAFNTAGLKTLFLIYARLEAVG